MVAFTPNWGFGASIDAVNICCYLALILQMCCHWKNSPVTGWGGLSLNVSNKCAPLPMCPIGHVPHCSCVKKMSSCQKDVKLSKRCQMSKSQTHRLWRRFTKKINWHNEVHTFWCQFWCHIWWSPKTLKMCIESVFEQFWWPSYLTSKLMSICVNLIMSIYFFCEPPP